MIHEETWRDVVGFEGLYEVSDLGSVRSKERAGIFKARWGMANMRFPAKQMRLNITRAGYIDVQLSMNAVKKHYLVHRLVAAAFLGVSDMQVNHKDGNKNNNAVENLEYCTSQENLLHCTRVLKKKIGESSGTSKLKSLDIDSIRRDPRKLREIAVDYGVTLQAIHLVKKGKNWGHI